jgi:hypothetical protein
MCAAAIYFVRRVVVALSAAELDRITASNPEKMRLALSCWEVFARGEHEVEVSGPHLEKQAGARGTRRLLGLKSPIGSGNIAGRWPSQRSYAGR